MIGLLFHLNYSCSSIFFSLILSFCFLFISLHSLSTIQSFGFMLSNLSSIFSSNLIILILHHLFVCYHFSFHIIRCISLTSHQFSPITYFQRLIPLVSLTQNSHPRSCWFKHSPHITFLCLINKTQHPCLSIKMRSTFSSPSKIFFALSQRFTHIRYMHHLFSTSSYLSFNILIRISYLYFTIWHIFNSR